MIRRGVWLGAGMAAGVGGTLWVERRVRRALTRLTPGGVGDQARASVQSAGARARSALAAARVERARTEQQLMEDFGARPRQSGSSDRWIGGEWPRAGTQGNGRRQERR